LVIVLPVSQSMDQRTDYTMEKWQKDTQRSAKHYTEN
jgi:hypothetical protein